MCFNESKYSLFVAPESRGADQRTGAVPVSQGM